MKSYCYLILITTLLVGCKNDKLIYKKIETKNFYLEGYTYSNYSDKIFPIQLVLIDKNTKDTAYQSENCFKDFNFILEDTLFIYGGITSDSIIDEKIILKRISVPQSFKNNIPWKDTR